MASPHHGFHFVSEEVQQGGHGIAQRQGAAEFERPAAAVGIPSQSREHVGSSESDAMQDEVISNWQDLCVKLGGCGSAERESGWGLPARRTTRQQISNLVACEEIAPPPPAFQIMIEAQRC